MAPRQVASPHPGDPVTPTEAALEAARKLVEYGTGAPNTRSLPTSSTMVLGLFADLRAALATLDAERRAPSPSPVEAPATCECCTNPEEACRCDDDCATGRERMAAGRDATDCRPLPAPPVEAGPSAEPTCAAEGAPSKPGTCFKCGAVVEPSDCFCGRKHTGTYCWPCHHKNVSSCAAPHCPEHGYEAAQKWLSENAPVTAPAPPQACPGDCNEGYGPTCDDPKCGTGKRK